MCFAPSNLTTLLRVCYTSETVEADHVRRFVCVRMCSYVVNLFKQKVLSQKNDLFATVTLQNNLFFVDSLAIFTAQIVHSHMY